MSSPHLPLGQTIHITLMLSPCDVSATLSHQVALTAMQGQVRTASSIQGGVGPCRARMLLVDQAQQSKAPTATLLIESCPCASPPL